MSEAMELLPPKQPEYLPAVSDSWDGAAQRGLQARRERESIISQVLKPGIDADYGIIPGTPKATLLKPGAEKIADSLNLYPDYEIVTKIEDFDRPLFHYSYRCRLTARGSNVVIATGIGSCNSMESRYRWREGKRKCPACGKDAIIKGKAEYGGGWLCFQKKDGCGAKFTDKDASITGQAVGRVLNDDIYSQINSIDKVAQKRAFVAATLNLGFSEQFTQDLEDGRVEEEPPAHVLPPTPVGTMGALGVGTQLRSGDPHYVQPQRATVPFVPASAPSAREPGDESDIPPADDEPPFPGDAPKPKRVAAKIADGTPTATGTIDQISEKPTKTGGVKFGLKVGDNWYNTFSETIGGEAKKAKALREVIEVAYSETKWGREIGLLTTSAGTF